MAKDYTKYNEILREARTKNNEVKRDVAKLFVPKLYEELINLGYEPYLARAKVEKDCRSMWEVETIVGELPTEAKDERRAIGGRKSAEVKKEKRVNEVKHWIIGNHFAFGKITEAFTASSDGIFRIGLNAKYDFLTAEPVTPKSVVTEPIAVRSVSSAPISST